MVKSRKHGQSATIKTGQFTTTANRYTPLTESRTENVSTIPVVVNGCTSTKRTTKVINRTTPCRKNDGIGETKQKRKKVIVIGDSHARGCARELSSYLGTDFEVRGTVMPGAGLTHITTLAQEEILNLTPQDAVIIWGGSNDIYKNETSRGLKHLLNFITHKENTNILALTAPHRHDLQETSYINKEIQVFNRKMCKMVKIRDNVSIIKTDLHRNDFTQHGLHLNIIGKERVAESIARTIKQLRERKKGIPIPIDEEGHPKDPWPQPQEPTIHAETKENPVSDTAPNEHLHSSRTSGRPKRPPVTRHDDFLWSTSATRTRQ